MRRLKHGSYRDLTVLRKTSRGKREESAVGSTIFAAKSGVTGASII
jgi:hypothetical protein